MQLQRQKHAPSWRDSNFTIFYSSSKNIVWAEVVLTTTHSINHMSSRILQMCFYLILLSLKMDISALNPKQNKINL